MYLQSNPRNRKRPKMKMVISYTEESQRECSLKVLPLQMMSHKIQITKEVVDSNADPVLLFKKQDGKKIQTK